jgi:hypothetical protein
MVVEETTVAPASMVLVGVLALV